MQPINNTTIKKQRHQRVCEGLKYFIRSLAGKVTPNFNHFSRIKQQQDLDWLAGPEMKWVMRTSESAETKGKFVMGKTGV